MKPTEEQIRELLELIKILGGSISIATMNSDQIVTAEELVSRKVLDKKSSASMSVYIYKG